MAQSVSESSRTDGHRQELDVMGVLVVLGLIFFHTAMIFDPFDFYVSNDPQSRPLAVFTGAGSLWGMPLMFLIAGMSIWYSLRKRTVGEFVLERFKRLFIPLIVGVLLFVPPLHYFELKGDPAYTETYVQFYRRFLNVRFTFDFPRFVTGASPDGVFGLGHMWFLDYLFVYTLLLLPLFVYLRTPRGRRLVGRLASFCTRRWADFLLGTPIGLIEAALGTEFGSGHWNRYAYIPTLLLGFLIAADARFGEAFRRHWKAAFVLGTIGLIGWFVGFVVLLETAQVDPSTDFSAVGLLTRMVRGLASWLWMVAIMGMAGRKRRPRTHQPREPRGPSLMERVGRYADEAQLPFYVMHFPFIIGFGFYVVRWDISALLKYIVICLASFVATVVLYDIGVRRNRATRFLFGMRPRETAIIDPKEPDHMLGIENRG